MISESPVHGKTLRSHKKNNEIKLSWSAWDDELELLDGSCFVADIQDYFEYITKNHEAFTDNPPFQYQQNWRKILHLKSNQVIFLNYYHWKPWNY